jgi:hypothetical protein
LTRCNFYLQILAEADLSNGPQARLDRQPAVVGHRRRPQLARGTRVEDESGANPIKRIFPIIQVFVGKVLDIFSQIDLIYFTSLQVYVGVHKCFSGYSLLYYFGKNFTHKNINMKILDNLARKI